MPSNVRATGGATEVVIPRIPMPTESADSKSAVVTSPSAGPIKAIPLERIVFPFTIAVPRVLTIPSSAFNAVIKSYWKFGTPLANEVAESN